MQIQEIARGNWPRILTAAGIDAAILDGKHHPCPCCGGTDRFRFDDLEGRGTFICHRCTESGAGDGFTLLQNYQGTDFKGAASFIESVLGVKTSQGNTSKKHFIKTPADAVSIWPELPPASPDHPYLKRKGIKAHVARQNGDDLIIPVYSNLAGTLVSVQRILSEKTKTGTDKLFIKGAAKKGNFCLIGGIDEEITTPILFCEGYATGATLHEAIGLPVVICFDSGNLPTVAAKLRPEIPGTFIYCGDADEAGRKAAKSAIKKAGGVACIPEFEPGQEGSDFNDLGTEATAAQLSPVLERIESGMLGAEYGPQEDKPQFKLEDGKLYRLRTSKNELGVETEYFCVGSAIEIKAGTMDARGGNHGRLLVFYSHHKEKTWVMPMAFLAGETSKLIGALLDRGYWCVAPHQKFIRDSIAEYINSVTPPETLTTTEATGWHGKTFVLTGGELIGDGEKIIFTGADTDIYAAAGSLDQWRREVAALAVGNSRLLFSVSLAFVGPLMPLAGDDGAGVNFYGITSTGKTTTQRAAASVWGSPEPGGFISKWNATAAGLELQAVQRNHTLFVIDELGEVDPKIAGRLIYQFTSGVQKGRGRASDAGVGLADLKTWKMPFISSAEKTVMQHVEEAGQRLYGGQAVRCVDIPADAGAGFGVFENLHGQAGGAEFSELIKGVTRKYHGTAGRAFVAALLKMGTAKALEFVTAKREVFAKEYLPSDAGGVVRRASKLFSLAAAAGELATHLKILPWEPGAAMDAAARCFKDWIAENGTGNPEERAALAQVEYFIQANMQNFRGWNETDASAGGRNIPRQVGYLSEDETVCYILPEIFKREACKGYRPEFVVKLLEARGALVTSPGRKQYSIRPPGSKQTLRVFAVKNDFAENELVTVVTVVTDSQECSNSNGFECCQSVTGPLPQAGKSVTTVTSGGNFVTSENGNKNNVVATVTSVTTQKTPEPKKYHAFKNGKPGVFPDTGAECPPRDDKLTALEDAAVLAGFKSWRAMVKQTGGRIPAGLEIREVSQ